MMQAPGPFRLEPVFLEKVWAARHLPPALAGLWPAPEMTGEIWLASDRHRVTPVAEGPLAGQGLDQVTARWGSWLLGQEPRPGQGFPLLLKILSVGQWLSVQVHPDDEQAARLENEPWGKSEAWHILEAEKDAAIIMGLEPGVDRQALARAVAEKRLGQVLARVPARPGDTFHLPAGTVHAAGPGLCFFEVQQSSDVTYRFYDWDRLGLDGKPRQLHQDKALAVMKTSGPGRPFPPRELESGPARLTLLVEDEHFALLRVEAAADYAPSWGGRRLRLVLVLSGRGRWVGPAGGELLPGQCWVVPAGLEGALIRPQAGGLVLLESLAL